MSYLREYVRAFEVALDEAVVVLPFLVLAFNRHLVADHLDTDLLRFEMGHVQVHFELFVIVTNLSTRSSRRDRYQSIFAPSLKSP